MRGGVLGGQEEGRGEKMAAGWRLGSGWFKITFTPRSSGLARSMRSIFSGWRDDGNAENNSFYFYCEVHKAMPVWYSITIHCLVKLFFTTILLSLSSFVKIVHEYKRTIVNTLLLNYTSTRESKLGLWINMHRSRNESLHFTNDIWLSSLFLLCDW